METLIFWYLLFSTATGLTAIYELYNPVVTKIKLYKPKSPLARHVWLGYITALLAFITLAPVVFIICIVPSLGEAFRESMYLGTLETDE